MPETEARIPRSQELAVPLCTFQVQRVSRYVVSRTEIESHIYDEQTDPMSNVVDSTIYRLRKKIESTGKQGLIRTRRGMGYVLEDPKK